MSKGNKNFALYVTKEAKNSTIKDCEVHGGAKIEGQGIRMIRTKIFQFYKESSIARWLLITVILGVFADLGSLYILGKHLWQLFTSS